MIIARKNSDAGHAAAGRSEKFAYRRFPNALRRAAEEQYHTV